MSLPKHIAVIMDGNGRWAKAKNKNRIFGHKKGVEATRQIIEACAEHDVEHLTLYAFSTENWRRPKDEVNGLMELLLLKIKQEINTFIKNKIRVRVLGDINRLPKKVQKALTKSIEQTKSFDKLCVNFALSYSSKWEIAEAIKTIARKVEHKELNPEDIDENTLDHYLTTHNIPNPDLLIRTGGEKRISNFLLYQIAYTELYFTDIFWPDFSKEEFLRALEFYSNTQRRFGMTGEQVNNIS